MQTWRWHTSVKSTQTALVLWRKYRVIQISSSILKEVVGEITWCGKGTFSLFFQIRHCFRVTTFFLSWYSVLFWSFDGVSELRVTESISSWNAVKWDSDSSCGNRSGKSLYTNRKVKRNAVQVKFEENYKQLSCACVRACRQPVSKGGRGMQTILKRFYQREKLGIWGKFLDLSRENSFGFDLKQNKLTESMGFSDWRHFASRISRHEMAMEHLQNCKNLFELKTLLGKFVQLIYWIQRGGQISVAGRRLWSRDQGCLQRAVFYFFDCK
jgi:hypothetical protein